MCEVQIRDYAGNLLSSSDVKARIEALRDLILGNDDLKKLRTDDAFLTRFLYRTHFHMDYSFIAVKNYYSYILEESDWIAFDISKKMEDFLNMNMRVMLPTFDNYGKRIFYMKTDTICPSKITLAELNQTEFIWFESVLDDINVQAHGLCLLVDITGFSWRILSWLSPTNIKKAIRKLENIIVKDATFHIVGSSRFATCAIKVLWPFMPEQIKEKFKFHFNDFKALLNYISLENLPEMYGGSLEVNFEALVADLLSRREEICKKLEHYQLIAS